MIPVSFAQMAKVSPLTLMVVISGEFSVGSGKGVVISAFRVNSIPRSRSSG